MGSGTTLATACSGGRCRCWARRREGGTGKRVLPCEHHALVGSMSPIRTLVQPTRARRPRVNVHRRVLQAHATHTHTHTHTHRAPRTPPLTLKPDGGLLAPHSHLRNQSTRARTAGIITTRTIHLASPNNCITHFYQHHHPSIHSQQHHQHQPAFPPAFPPPRERLRRTTAAASPSAVRGCAPSASSAWGASRC
jgi:hypothetical protein